jgi:hypothetical protein
MHPSWIFSLRLVVAQLFNTGRGSWGLYFQFASTLNKESSFSHPGHGLVLNCPWVEGRGLWTESWSKSERKVFFRKTSSDDCFERLSSNPQQICMLIGIIYSKQGSRKIALHNNSSLIWSLQFGLCYWIKGKAKLLEVLQNDKQTGNSKWRGTLFSTCTSLLFLMSQGRETEWRSRDH